MKSKRKPTQKFLATMLYIPPDGVTPIGEKPNIVTNAKVDTLPKVLDYLREHFDGYETFTEHFMPEIKEFFKNNKKMTDIYHGDDWSAGQGFQIVRVNKSGVSVDLTQ